MPERILDRGTLAPPLFYQADGTGRPVVLIHGVGADSSSWDGIAPRLATVRRVLRLDLRGHGRSGRIIGGCTLGDLVQDVLDVMNAENLRVADVAGFSLGGMIAQGLALDHADRVDRLVLINAAAGRTAEERARVRDQLATLADQGIDAIAASARERWFSPGFQAAHPDQVAARMGRLRRNDVESYKAAYTVYSTSDLGGRLGGIERPTLVVTGGQDVTSNARMARFMHERIPGSRLHILPGLRHGVLTEAPDLVADLLLDFLADPPG